MIKIGSGNWIVDNLNSALETWNGKLTEIWQLISTTPEAVSYTHLTLPTNSRV